MTLMEKLLGKDYHKFFYEQEELDTVGTKK